MPFQPRRCLTLAMCAMIAAITVPATPLMAKDPSPKKLMDMVASCTYVVGVAEGNNVKLRYSSADWVGVMRQFEQKTGLDSEPSLQLAKAKYNRRARVMGADEALAYMKSQSKQCDKEMAVIKS